MNAPFLVPTNTRTLLIGHPFRKRADVLLTQSNEQKFLARARRKCVLCRPTLPRPTRWTSPRSVPRRYRTCLRFNRYPNFDPAHSGLGIEFFTITFEEGRCFSVGCGGLVAGVRQPLGDGVAGFMQFRNVARDGEKRHIEERECLPP